MAAAMRQSGGAPARGGGAPRRSGCRELARPPRAFSDVPEAGDTRLRAAVAAAGVPRRRAAEWRERHDTSTLRWLSAGVAAILLGDLSCGRRHWHNMVPHAPRVRRSHRTRESGVVRTHRAMVDRSAGDAELTCERSIPRTQALHVMAVAGTDPQLRMKSS